jgi:hypothetical protein
MSSAEKIRFRDFFSISFSPAKGGTMHTLFSFLTYPFLFGLAVVLVVFLLMMALGAVCFVLRALWVVFYPLYFMTLKPVVWCLMKAFHSRCPQCQRFWKRQFVKSEVIEQWENLETVERIDYGVVYSNELFTPNHGYEICRLEQVRMVNETIRYFWECKDPLCGHKWTTEEYTEREGSL